MWFGSLFATGKSTPNLSLSLPSHRSHNHRPDEFLEPRAFYVWQCMCMCVCVFTVLLAAGSDHKTLRMNVPRQHCWLTHKNTIHSRYIDHSQHPPTPHPTPGSQPPQLPRPATTTRVERARQHIQYCVPIGTQQYIVRVFPHPVGKWFRSPCDCNMFGNVFCFTLKI